MTCASHHHPSQTIPSFSSSSSRNTSWKLRFDDFRARPLNFSLLLTLLFHSYVHPPRLSDHSGFRVTRVCGEVNDSFSAVLCL